MSEEKKTVNCGLVMPISAIDGCSSEHWQEVKSILIDAIKSNDTYNFEIKMVSEADEIGVIQKRIVQNLYNSDIVVCDVSCKNPNVMFELGMRLAFDKPTIIIKDDKTEYTFDTGIIEHVTYPRDLRFTKILDFKEKLSRKVLATYDQAKNPEHSTFLKNFGQFKVASLDETEVTENKYIISALQDIQSELLHIRRSNTRRSKNTVNIRLLKKYIQEYIRNDGTMVISASDLIGDELFYDYIQEKIDAPIHFDSRNEFKEFVNFFLKNSFEEQGIVI